MNKGNETQNEQVKKTGHIYDGIEELDHSPPNWFRALFYGTIAFGAAYFIYYSIGDGPDQLTEYTRAKAADDLVQFEARAREPVKQASEQDLEALVKDGAIVKLGAKVFESKCLSCHGSRGEGGIGPNLTDAHWLHGGNLVDVLKVIAIGVTDKGMPPWGAILSVGETQAVTAFVGSIRGTNPEGAKAPQGELFKKQ